MSFYSPVYWEDPVSTNVSVAVQEDEYLKVTMSGGAEANLVRQSRRPFALSVEKAVRAKCIIQALSGFAGIIRFGFRTKDAGWSDYVWFELNSSAPLKAWLVLARNGSVKSQQEVSLLTDIFAKRAYEVVWSASKAEFWVDGKLYGRLEEPNNIPSGPLRLFVQFYSTALNSAVIFSPVELEVEEAGITIRYD